MDEVGELQAEALSTTKKQKPSDSTRELFGGVRGNSSRPSEAKRQSRRSGNADTPDELETLRRRAQSQASLLLGQATLDDNTRALMLEANVYIQQTGQSPKGTSPQAELLARVNQQGTHPALKPQLWYLIGEIYIIEGQRTQALEAYKQALGQ
jgi:hypothetical protein